MRDDDDRLSLGDQIIKQGKDRLGGLRVKVAGGFISHDQGWIVGEGAGQSCALLLAARYHAGKFVLVI